MSILRDLLQIYCKYEPKAYIKRFDQKNADYIFIPNIGMHERDEWLKNMPKNVKDELRMYEYSKCIDITYDNTYDELLISYTGLSVDKYNTDILKCILENNGFNDGKNTSVKCNGGVLDMINYLIKELDDIGDLYTRLESDNKHPLMEYYEITERMYVIVPMIRLLSTKMHLLFDKKSCEILYKDELKNYNELINNIITKSNK